MNNIQVSSEKFERFLNTTVPNIPNLCTAQSEAHFALNAITPYLERNSKILEIGSGAGLLVGFLHDEGYSVTGVEPGYFRSFSDAETAIKRHTKCSILDVAIEELDLPAGEFDFIYTMHSVEHFSDLERAFHIMSNLLRPGGKMLHVCPNYVFPYEPHLGQFFFPWSKPDYEVNYVTSFKLKKLAKTLGLECQLQRCVMANYAGRFSNDPVFARRLKQFSFARHLTSFLKMVPAWAGSPMIALFQKRL